MPADREGVIVTTVVHRPVPSSPGCRIVVIFELRYLQPRARGDADGLAATARLRGNLAR